MNSLNLLLQNLPPWVKIENRSKDEANVIASPLTVGGSSSHDYYLRLKLSHQNGISVAEQPKHRQFPEFCLERHINPDSTFCIFLGSEAPLKDDEAANVWWSHLGKFLNDQLYAEKRKLWPLEAGLSHGDAAYIQLKREKLAEPLGWRDDIWRAIFRGKGWMAKHLPRVSKEQDRVLNARTPCPRNCTWKHKRLRKKPCVTEQCNPSCRKQHRPILRAKCPHRGLIEDLILLEHQRRKIEAKLVQDLLSKGKGCCGSMVLCPLRKAGHSQ